MAREKLALGVDIGQSSVKICQLRHDKTGTTLERFASAKLPADTVVDGQLMNPSAVVQALQELLNTYKISQKQVATAISGHAVIIKKITLPAMSAGELADQENWEIAQFIPFAIDECYLDLQILGPSLGQEGSMDVVLVAAKKDFVNDYTSVLQEAGLEPIICDVDVFAVETMFLRNYDLAGQDTIALVHVGAAKTCINLLSKGRSVFTRDLTYGGNAFTNEIQGRLRLSWAQAEDAKLQRQGDSFTQIIIQQDIVEAMQQIGRQIAAEVQRSLDFHNATGADVHLQQIFLSGGGARLDVVPRMIQQHFGTPVEVIDPFRKIHPGVVDVGILASIGPAAAVAVGLALRYPGDC